MRTLLLLLFLGMSSLFVSSQQTYLQADHMRSRTELYSSLIKTLKVSNDEASSHVQGIAVDIENGYIYFYTSHFSEFQFKYQEQTNDDNPTAPTAPAATRY